MFKKFLTVATVVASLVSISGCSTCCKSKPVYNNTSLTEENRKAKLTDFSDLSDRVFFKLNEYKIAEDAKSLLMKHAEWLKSNPDTKATLEGHCDERGTREYNIALGERRANAVKKFLIEQGVDGDRLATISYGKERPAVIGNDKESWSKNRRTVTIIK